MNWDDIKQRKEESIRESTGNPMPPIDINGKTYDKFSDYLASDEYKELLEDLKRTDNLNLQAEDLEIKVKLETAINTLLKFI